MSERRLAVWLGGERVGTLSATEGDAELRFTYAEPAPARPVSLALPLEGEPRSSFATRAFFDGLLPEQSVREQSARQLGISPGNSFGLLRALGRDCAGAVVLLDEDAPAPRPGGTVEWLTRDELDQLVAGLRRAPLGAGQKRRASLAGAQSKVVLVRDPAGRYGLPWEDAPSTHLLKPQWPDTDWPDIAFNERFCMRVAECVGFTVARTSLVTVADLSCLLVERYDRTFAGPVLTRIHQEDLCQAFGISPIFKYQAEGGPSVAAAVDLLRRSSVRAGADVLAFVDAVIFNWAIGNSDAHGKNFSLLHADDGLRLAPLYDLVSTAVYPELDHDLAMAVGETFDPDAVDAGDWLDFADDAGLRFAALERRRDALLARIARCATTVRDLAVAEGWHRPVIDDVVALVERRAAGREAVS